MVFLPRPLHNLCRQLPAHDRHWHCDMGRPERKQSAELGAALLAATIPMPARAVTIAADGDTDVSCGPANAGLMMVFVLGTLADPGDELYIEGSKGTYIFAGDPAAGNSAQFLGSATIEMTQEGQSCTLLWTGTFWWIVSAGEPSCVDTTGSQMLVPSGGSSGEILMWQGARPEWTASRPIPAGGNDGDVLTLVGGEPTWVTP